MVARRALHKLGMASKQAANIAKMDAKIRWKGQLVNEMSVDYFKRIAELNSFVAPCIFLAIGHSYSFIFACAYAVRFPPNLEMAIRVGQYFAGAMVIFVFFLIYTEIRTASIRVFVDLAKVSAHSKTTDNKLRYWSYVQELYSGDSLPIGFRLGQLPIAFASFVRVSVVLLASRFV